MLCNNTDLLTMELADHQLQGLRTHPVERPDRRELIISLPKSGEVEVGRALLSGTLSSRGALEDPDGGRGGLQKRLQISSHYHIPFEQGADREPHVRAPHDCK